MVVAIVFALAMSTPAPAEEQTPPKQIIDVHSEKTLCTTLRETVEPVLAGLLKDDQVIDVGERALAKMMRDRAEGSPAAGMDRLQLEYASRAMIHNLAVIDDLLADANKFPANPRNDADKTANKIKTDLQGVVTWQKQKLNELYGMMDTDELGSMQSDFPNSVPGYGSLSTRLDPDMQTRPVQTAPPVAAAGVAAAPGDAAPASGARGGTTPIAILEDRASAEIVRAVSFCAPAP